MEEDRKKEIKWDTKNALVEKELVPASYRQLSYRPTVIGQQIHETEQKVQNRIRTLWQNWHFTAVKKDRYLINITEAIIISVDKIKSKPHLHHAQKPNS